MPTYTKIEPEEKKLGRSNGLARSTDRITKKTDVESLANERFLLEDEVEEDSQATLAFRVPRVSPSVIIPLWISLSGGLIMFNKWILTTKGFSFPVFLTAYHMLVAIIGTNILRYTTNLLAAAETPLPGRIWKHAIIPIGLLYALSLVLSNAAYVHLSVSFVQMIKASIPVLVHLFCCAAGFARMDRVTAVILLTISAGCVIASTGELRYDFVGLACQLGAVAEAYRLVVVQVLLRDLRMTPLVSIYYYAPVCLAFISTALPLLEGAKPFYAIYDLGWHILLANGLMSFALNVCLMFLIHSSGSLVTTLSGVAKDIVLISLSVLLLGSVVTGQQIFGYGIALTGLISFKNKDYIVAWLENDKSSSSSGFIFVSSKALTKLILAWCSALLIAFIAFRSLRHLAPSEVGFASYIESGRYLNDARLTRSLRHTTPFNIAKAPLPLSSDPSRTQFPIHGSAADLVPAYSPDPDPSTLTPFAWVIVSHVDRHDRHAEIISHINCYCLRLGIPLYLDWVLHDNDRHFFTARHYNIVKYLKRHQWVMVTDADILIADSTKDPRDLIAVAAADDVDVIFSDRGSEVCACVYLIKNSPGGWSFLQRWIAWSGETNKHNPNWDNGDLNELLLSGTRPGFPANQDGSGRLTRAEVADLMPSLTEEQKVCSNLDIPHHYVWTFLPCFARSMLEYRSAELWKPWWTIRIFEWSTSLPPTTVRVYREFGGLARNDPGDISSHFKKRVDTDFLYHLHKNATMFNSSMVLCTGEEWQFEPAATDEGFRQWVHNYHDQSYHKCWDSLGDYHCGVDGPKQGWGRPKLVEKKPDNLVKLGF